MKSALYVYSTYVDGYTVYGALTHNHKHTHTEYSNRCICVYINRLSVSRSSSSSPSLVVVGVVGDELWTVNLSAGRRYCRANIMYAYIWKSLSPSVAHARTHTHTRRYVRDMCVADDNGRTDTKTSALGRQKRQIRGTRYFRVRSRLKLNRNWTEKASQTSE